MIDIAEFGDRYLTATLKSAAIGALAAMLWPWLWVLWHVVTDGDSYQFVRTMAAAAENHPGPPTWSYTVVAVAMATGIFWVDWRQSRKLR